MFADAGDPEGVALLAVGGYGRRELRGAEALRSRVVRGCKPPVAEPRDENERSSRHLRAIGRPSLGAHAVVLAGYDERFVRIWDYYLSFCEAGFRERILREFGPAALPLFNDLTTDAAVPAPASITTSSTPRRLGSSNIVSSKMPSMIDRKPRAPVFRSIAFFEMVRSESSAKLSCTSSISNSR